MLLNLLVAVGDSYMFTGQFNYNGTIFIINFNI